MTHKSAHNTSSYRHQKSYNTFNDNHWTIISFWRSLCVSSTLPIQLYIMRIHSYFSYSLFWRFSIHCIVVPSFYSYRSSFYIFFQRMHHVTWIATVPIYLQQQLELSLCFSEESWMGHDTKQGNKWGILLSCCECAQTTMRYDMMRINNADMKWIGREKYSCSKLIKKEVFQRTSTSLRPPYHHCILYDITCPLWFLWWMIHH